MDERIQQTAKMIKTADKNIIFTWDDTSRAASISVTPETGCDSAEYYRITVDYPEKRFPERIGFSWFVEFDDIFSCWTPGARFTHGLFASWRPLDQHSRSASGAPVFALLSKGGENRCTFALADCAVPVRMTGGVEEPNGKIRCTLELFTNRVDMIDHYETVLRIDRSREPFYDSLQNVRHWWTSIGYTPAHVPADAKRAMFSSWYNFQKNITEETVLEQCRMAKEYGLDTVILDDGWQCDEVRSGYTCCGDWEAVPSKFPDMRRFVDRLHEIGMKCMLWYSVPFVGIYAKNITRFEGKFLRSKDSSNTVMILDPRFADVRAWLVETYETAVRDWDLDGLKLDFIDSFSLSETSSTDYNAMDCPSLEAAVEKLLCEVMTALRRIKPDIMIEFRQSYIGPVMQKYGSILRVGDCAGGSLINRVSSTDMRLICEDTAVHSDMLMWDYEAAPEGAADQLSNILFAVPQISIMFDRLSPEHKKMLKFYLSFMAENRDVLLNGKFMPLCPDANYAQILAQKDGKVIAALYSNPLFVKPDDADTVILCNASGSAAVYVENNGSAAEKKCVIKNCMGETIADTVVGLINGVTKFEVPHNGFLSLTEIH